MTGVGAHDHLPRDGKAVEAVPVDRAALGVGDGIRRHDHRDDVGHRLDSLELGERFRLLEEATGQRPLVVGDEFRRWHGHRLDVVERRPVLRDVRLVAIDDGLHPLPAQVLALRRAGDIREEGARRIRDPSLLQAGVADELAHARRRHAFERHVGAGVVAVSDHRLQRAARLGRAGEVLEHGAAERTHAVVDGELLGLVEAPGFDLLQVGREHERLEAAADEELGVGIGGYAPRARRLVDVDLRALRPGELEEAVKQMRYGMRVGRLATVVGCQCRCAR